MRWINKYGTKWHRKFALFPRRIGDVVVWLESYERKYDGRLMGYRFWKYRLPGEKGEGA